MTFDSHLDADDTEPNSSSDTAGRTGARDGRGDGATAAFSRRDVLQAGAAGLATVGLGASTPASAQSDGPPSYDEAASQLSHPDPAPEAVALYRYLHDVWGEQILSGQQHETWGIDEIDHVESVTGQLPAVKGVDFIHGKARPVDWAIDWWEQGGITKAMWHWGVPSQETPSDPYEQSQNPSIDLQSILEEGTEANQTFYDELDEVAAELQRAGDEGVPILFGPFHEFEGEWFWWGMEGAEFFVELWETVHEYFVGEWDLDNLVWLLPHMDYPDQSWVPDESTFDLAGADTYDDGESYQWLYENVTSVHGEDRPVVMHEIGSPGQPPDPEAVAADGNWWSMWVNWHTSWLEDLDESYLDYVYNHELTATLSDVPDVVREYGEPGPTCDLPEFRQYVRVDGGDRTETDEVSVEPGAEVELAVEPEGADYSWSGGDLSADTRVVTVSPAETTTYAVTVDVGCETTPTLEFAVAVEASDDCVAAGAAESAQVDGRTVCDVDGDGYYRDVTGDGSVGQTDVVEFFEVQHRDAWKQPSMFDFSGNGEVGHGDVVDLFEFVAMQP